MTDRYTIHREPGMNRRQFIRAGAAAVIFAGLPSSAWASKLLSQSPERSLSLFNTHTGEKLKQIVYWESGRYLEDSLHSIDYLLRDHRTDEVTRIDEGALDILFAIRQKFPVGRPFEIISGYRSQETNRVLRKKTSGVAKTSFHMSGQAIDLRLPGVPLKTLRKAALNLQYGGVGYYPQSDFIHVDTGPVRHW